MGSTSVASTSLTDEALAVRRQMAETRAEMAQTIEQLETRLDPKLLEEKAKTVAYDATIGKAKTMVSRTSNGIVDSIKANPVPLALTALGLGWLIVNARAPQAQARVVSAIGDKTDDLKQQATDLAQTAQAKARDVAHQAQARGREVETSAVRVFDANPLAIGLGVAAVGLVLGLAVPTTQKENELLGPARDRLAHEALGKAQDLAHKALDTANEQLAGGDHQGEQAKPEQQEPFPPSVT